MVSLVRRLLRRAFHLFAISPNALSPSHPLVTSPAVSFCSFGSLRPTRSVTSNARLFPLRSCPKLPWICSRSLASPAIRSFLFRVPQIKNRVACFAFPLPSNPPLSATRLPHLHFLLVLPPRLVRINFDRLVSRRLQKFPDFVSRAYILSLPPLPFVFFLFLEIPRDQPPKFDAFTPSDRQFEHHSARRFPCLVFFFKPQQLFLCPTVAPPVSFFSLRLSPPLDICRRYPPPPFPGCRSRCGGQIRPLASGKSVRLPRSFFSFPCSRFFEALLPNLVVCA